MQNINPIPKNEHERLSALRSFTILDTLPEEQFDRLTHLASVICEVPITLISFVDEDRQWFKSKVGLDATETPRNISFCQYAIMSEDLFEVEDTWNDERFKNNPLVTGNPNIRFYAGQPLTHNDLSYGTLCVIDDKPKKLNDSQKLALRILAQEVVSQMNLKKKEKETETLETLFSLSMDLICIAGVDGYFKRINPAFTKILGYTKNELLSHPFLHYVHPKDVQTTLEEMKKLSEGKKTVDFINRYRTADGIYKTLSWTANPNPTNGEIYAIARDITEKIFIEENLIKSKEQQLVFFNNSQSIMFTHDIFGNLLDVNTAMARSLNYTGDELKGKNLKELMRTEKDVLVNYLSTIKKGSASGLMNVTSKLGEEKIWVYNNILSSDYENKPYVICNAVDVTNRIAIEKELKRAKEQAEKNANAKDLFLTNMSHEIRTPMNAIIGFSEMLASTHLDSNQKEYLHAVQMAGENLLVIINDILDFSKIETGNLVLEKTAINPKEILTDVKKLLAPKADEKQLKFNLYKENDIPEYVVGDKVRLNQILINIIGNAIKFTEAGKVEVFCSVISKNKDFCIIEFNIKDTGIGIAADKQERVFERFKQADDNTTRKYGGTGLGLSITKKLVELFNGTIQLTSELRKGSEFIIQIPFQITEKHIENDVQFFNEKGNNNNVSVLLVEDNELNQKLARRTLEQNKIKVEVVENGQLAIDALHKQKFDVIIMDLQMPVMDGYAATDIIRRQLKIKTPIIAMTAHSMVGEKDKCILSGMNDYLSKPFKASEFVEKINNLASMFKEKNSGDKKASDAIVEEKENILEKMENFYSTADLEDLAGGDSTFVKDSIKIFVKNIPEELQKLKTAIAEKNVDAAKKIAHQIKPNYGLFMADKGFKTCNAIEQSDNIDYMKKEIEILSDFSSLLIQELSKKINDELQK